MHQCVIDEGEEEIEETQLTAEEGWVVMGCDPAPRNMGISIRDMADGRILWTGLLHPYAGKSNAWSVPVWPLCKKMMSVISGHPELGPLLVRVKHVGVEQAIKKKKMFFLTGSLCTFLSLLPLKPTVKVYAKSAYYKAACTGNYSQNKALSIQEYKEEVAPWVKKGMKLGDICDASALAKKVWEDNRS